MMKMRGGESGPVKRNKWRKSKRSEECKDIGKVRKKNGRGSRGNEEE